MANRIIDTDTNDTVTFGTVTCPICELVHDLRKTQKKRVPFFVCDTCGSSTVVFIRSAWAKEKLTQWAGHATHVPLRNEAAEDRTSVSSKEAKTPEEYPADEAEDHLKRLVNEWSIKPIRRRVRRH